MKKLMTIALLALAAALSAEAKTYATYNKVTYAVDGDIVLGEWTSQYTKALEYAEAKHLPLIVFWGNRGCSICQGVESKLGTNKDFLEWQVENGIVMVYVINNVTGSDATLAKNALGSGSYPIVGYYWLKKGETPRRNGSKLKFDHVFTGSGNNQPAKIMSYAQTYFYNQGYKPLFNVMGAFDVDGETETAFNRLEAEAAGPVAIRLTREDGGEEVDGTLEVSVAIANGPTVIPVHWDASDKQQQQFVEVTIPNGLSAGDEITLTLKNELDESENSAVIHYVAKAEKPTSTNPLWFGERTTSNLQYGEWTMDLDTALAKVKNDGGYTIALVQGSQWCGDCYNVEQKFLSKASSGVNVFCDWAKKHHVALAVIDVPSFTNNTVDSAYSSLLKRDAAKKKLGEVEALRSGLAYLTRKGADREGGTAAADILERNRKLVQTNTKAFAYDDKHGFHRPEDSNAYRIGVPNFVLIRRDGTVAARLSRWAASTKADELDEAKTSDYLKRFDEMLVLDKKATEIENNYASSGSIPLDPNGAKTEEASLCAADTRDVFHLTGFGGGALEKITVSGLSNSVGKVKVAFVTLDADGKEQIVGTEKTEKLSKAGFTHENTFESGDYYVRVSAADVTAAGDFAIGSTNENHFQWYSVKGEQILIPGEQKVTTAAPASDELIVRLTSNEIYRLEHNLSCDPAAALVPLAEAGANFYTAATNGDVTIKVDSTHQLVHQLWKSNTVGFIETSSTVTDDVCDRQGGKPLELQVGRFSGKSGKIRVSVSVNEAETTLRPDKNQDQEIYKRYELQTSELVWEDGDPSPKTVLLKIIDLEGYYDPGKVVLDLKVEEAGYDCGLASDKNKYVLDVGTKDVAKPGKAMFSRVSPYAAKAKTIYVKEGDTGTVYAARFENSDGLVSVILKSSVAGVEFAADDPRDLQTGEDGVPNHFYWASHEMTEKAIYVSNVPAGKTAKITMTAFNKKGTPSKSQFKVHSSSNYVSVVGVAADCPEFTVGRQPYGLDRYVYFTNAIPLKAGTYTNSAEYANKQYQKTFTKLSGTLPSGLKAVWDKSNDNLAIFGIPTVKAGTYTAVYQVSEKRPSGKSAKNVAGLTVEIVFTVVDPVDTKQPGGALNPAAATSRTLYDLAVFGADEGREVVRLAGTLQLTIPPTGKLSAKYVCTTGTVSLSAKSWTEFDSETYGLYAELEGSGKYKDYTLKVWVNTDYSVEGEMHDPHFQSGDLGVFSDGKVWTKGSTSKTKPVPANTAEDWAGYYTVALVPQNIVEERTDIYTNTVAPRGTGYLTLKMDTASAWNAGKVTWAGMLPNGTTLSGSTVLTRGDDELIGTNTCVYLPVFKKTTTDIVGLVAEIEAFASTKENRRCVNDGIAVPYWKHLEKTADAKASYYMDLDVCGALYDKNEPLNKCCMADGGTLHVDVGALGGWIYAGTPTNITDIAVEVVTSTKPANDTLKVSNDKSENPQSIKLSFNRSTGIVSGSFKLPYTTVDGMGATKEKTQSVNYKGIVLSGWDHCGQCGDKQDGDVYLPFVNAAYYFSDKLPYVKSGNEKTLSVKRGGGVTVKANDED